MQIHKGMMLKKSGPGLGLAPEQLSSHWRIMVRDEGHGRDLFHSGRWIELVVRLLHKLELYPPSPKLEAEL